MALGKLSTAQLANRPVSTELFACDAAATMCDFSQQCSSTLQCRGHADSRDEMLRYFLCAHQLFRVSTSRLKFVARKTFTKHTRFIDNNNMTAHWQVVCEAQWPDCCRCHTAVPSPRPNVWAASWHFVFEAQWPDSRPAVGKDACLRNCLLVGRARGPMA